MLGCGLVLEVPSGRTVLSPAIVAAKVALCSGPGVERKLGNGCATISTGPVSFHHGPLKPSLIFLFHFLWKYNLISKKNLDVTSSIAPNYRWGGNCTPTLVQKLVYSLSSFLSSASLWKQKNALGGAFYTKPPKRLGASVAWQKPCAVFLP